MSDRPLLVLDTATRTPVVALATSDGDVIGARSWQSLHRHGERLLEELDGLLAESGKSKRAIGGVIVGTGPGSFTGLRIGLATAKVVAYSLSVPLVGISTTRALALASGVRDAAVTLPAGVADRYVHRLRVDGESVDQVTEPQLVAGAEAFSAAVGDATVVAVDIEDGTVPLDLGRTAVAGLASALARLGAAELEHNRLADPAQLVPAYVALPRGIARAAVDMEWSPDLR